MERNKKLLALVVTLTMMATVMAATSIAQEPPTAPPLVGNTSFPVQGEYPAVGYLLADYPGTTGSCTATLVAPTWVLTAAHCVLQDDGFGGDLHADDINILLNSVDANANPLPPDAEWHTASGWIIHGDYDPFEFANDVALVQLSTPSAIAPMQLTTNTSLVTAANGSPLPALVFGYGQNCAVGPCSDGLLRQGTTSIVSDSDAEAFISPQGFSTDVLDTATFMLPNVSINGALCFGDSGGPTFVQEGADLRIAGVNSFIFTATGGLCDVISGNQYLNAIADVVSSDLASFVAQVIDTPTLSCFDTPVTFEGTSFPDLIITQDGVDVIASRGGADYVESRGGADKLCGGSAGDLLAGGNGADSIKGQAGHDYLYGDKGDDLITGGLGHDTIFGGSGDDVIKGHSGWDEIWGGKGNDDIHGGKWKDEIHGDDGHDFIRGGGGDDKIWGNRGRDTLWGGTGADRLAGGTWSDEILGGKGSDTLLGHGGMDALDGGAGTDDCNGGPGVDTTVDCE